MSETVRGEVIQVIPAQKVGRYMMADEIATVAESQRKALVRVCEPDASLPDRLERIPVVGLVAYFLSVVLQVCSLGLFGRLIDRFGSDRETWTVAVDDPELVAVGDRVDWEITPLGKRVHHHPDGPDQDVYLWEVNRGG